MHTIENTNTEVHSVDYLERLEQLIFTYKKVLASWLHSADASVFSAFSDACVKAI